MVGRSRKGNYQHLGVGEQGSVCISRCITRGFQEAETVFEDCGWLSLRRAIQSPFNHITKYVYGAARRVMRLS